MPELQSLHADTAPENTFFQNFAPAHEFEKIDGKRPLLNTRKIDKGEGRPESIMLAIEDVTKKENPKDSIFDGK